jgi:hypothetical protein
MVMHKVRAVEYDRLVDHVAGVVLVSPPLEVARGL